jgi:hypothetical protein
MKLSKTSIVILIIFFIFFLIGLLLRFTSILPMASNPTLSLLLIFFYLISSFIFAYSWIIIPLLVIAIIYDIKRRKKGEILEKRDKKVEEYYPFPKKSFFINGIILLLATAYILRFYVWGESLLLSFPLLLIGLTFIFIGVIIGFILWKKVHSKRVSTSKRIISFLNILFLIFILLGFSLSWIGLGILSAFTYLGGGWLMSMGGSWLMSIFMLLGLEVFLVIWTVSLARHISQINLNPLAVFLILAGLTIASFLFIFIWDLFLINLTRTISPQ